MLPFMIIKRDAVGREVLRYEGRVLARHPHMICLQAVFQIPQADVAGLILLQKGDIFTEWFYTDRWYNIFHIRDGQTGAFKCWYCNITRPADIQPDYVASDDLALDVLILADGQPHILDEAEFSALTLLPNERRMAWDAVEEIQRLYRENQYPFNQKACP